MFKAARIGQLEDDKEYLEKLKNFLSIKYKLSSEDIETVLSKYLSNKQKGSGQRKEQLRFQPRFDARNFEKAVKKYAWNNPDKVIKRPKGEKFINWLTASRPSMP